MYKTLYGKIMNSTINRHAPGTGTKIDSDLSPAADFCMNRCPHSEKSCNGTCSELQEFKKTHAREYNSIGGIF